MIHFMAAFTVGLVGSLHCVGMCGPIAATLNLSGEKNRNPVPGILLYNLGRIITYSLLGLFFGLLGAGFSLSGMQQFFSISIGILLLTVALFSLNIENILLRWKWTNRFFFFVKTRLSIFLQKKSLESLFFIGVMNGLLPCGLVYVALAGAVTSGTIIGGISWMFAFGLGTVPLMIIAGLSGSLVSLKMRNFFKKAYPVVLMLVAGLLIFRGLEIQIPNDWYLAQLLTGQPLCH